MPSLKINKESQQSHSLCIFLCLKKETCTTWRMSFHVKLSTGMSEKCTCFNDFLHFCLAFVEPFCSFGCQKFNCTNALFHLMNKGNICPRLMHIIFTCQVEPSTCWIGFWCSSRILGGRHIKNNGTPMLIHVDDFAMTSPAESFHYDIVYVFFIHLKSKGDNENEFENGKK